MHRMPEGPPPRKSALSALKGRDLRAVAAFREKVKSGLGKALVTLRYLSRRALDVAPEAAAPPAKPAAGKLAIAPAPEPPGELRFLALVLRRDVWVEERIDEAALQVALETGAIVAPFVFTAEEWAAPLARTMPLAAEAERGEDLP